MIRVLTQVGVYMHTIQLEKYCILLFSNLYPTSIFVANEYSWNFMIETALCKITLRDLAANLVCLFFFEYIVLNVMVNPVALKFEAYSYQVYVL